MVAACSALIAGCAAPTKISTNKAQNYTTEPKRIFVLTDIGSDFGTEYANGFQRKAISIVKDCGAEMQVQFLSALELDESTYDQKRKAYKADTVLSIKRAGGTKSEYGVLIQVIYDIKLYDTLSNKVVWRANTTFSRGGGLIPVVERGETLAIDLTNKMKEDKVFQSCPLIKAAK